MRESWPLNPWLEERRDKELGTWDRSELRADAN